MHVSPAQHPSHESSQGRLQTPPSHAAPPGHAPHWPPPRPQAATSFPPTQSSPSQQPSQLSGLHAGGQAHVPSSQTVPSSQGAQLSPRMPHASFEAPGWHAPEGSRHPPQLPVSSATVGSIVGSLGLLGSLVGSVGANPLEPSSSSLAPPVLIGSTPSGASPLAQPARRTTTQLPANVHGTSRHIIAKTLSCLPPGRTRSGPRDRFSDANPVERRAHDPAREPRSFAAWIQSPQRR